MPCVLKKGAGIIWIIVGLYYLNTGVTVTWFTKVLDIQIIIFISVQILHDLKLTALCLHLSQVSINITSQEHNILHVAASILNTFRILQHWSGWIINLWKWYLFTFQRLQITGFCYIESPWWMFYFQLRKQL